MKNGGKPKGMLISLGFAAFFIVANMGKKYAKIDIFDLKLPTKLPTESSFVFETQKKRSAEALPVNP
jgi:hypothetical protein